VLLPFFYWGVYLLWRRRQWFLLVWLALSPLPAAITRDQYAVIRATAMIPAVIFSLSWGLLSFIKFLITRRQLFIFPVLVLIYGYFACIYAFSYYLKYPFQHASSWQFGNRQMVNLIKTEFSKYDQIIITKRYGEPHEYILWYWPWDPQAFQNDRSLKWDFHDNWYWINALSHLRFVNDWEIIDMAKALPRGNKYLIISSGDSQPDGAKVGQINYPDGSPAYVITAI
jgi:hypothetical protein